MRPALPIRSTASLGLVLACWLWPSPGRAQVAVAVESQLRVVVLDPTGAVIPGAQVTLRAAPGTEPIEPTTFETDGRGQVTFRRLDPGSFTLHVEARGFEAQDVGGVRVRTGDNRRDVRLRIARVRQDVTVRRDPREAKSDPRGDAFGTVLTPEQIKALPDDPEEMEEALKQMAGPGAAIRVNGFRGGRLPPKSQIQQIRIQRDTFAAENHQAGFALVDIVTKPGGGFVTGSVDFAFRDDAMNARNAFAPIKGPERRQRFGFNLGGPLKQGRTSFGLSVDGTSAYDSQTIVAATPAGRVLDVARVPSDQFNVMARVDHLVRGAHIARAEFQRSGSGNDNLGVGGFNLPDRAFSRDRAETLVRLSESGPVGKKAINETRLQVRWDHTMSTARSTAPAEIVLGAFSQGGAQIGGTRRSRSVELVDNLDYITGRHSWRFGLLFEAARYRSDEMSNAGGTFTFSSLDAYAAGLPATFSRRVGDPLVEFSQYQVGWYAQDDIRVRKDLSVSVGLRHEVQTHVPGRLNLGPRAGFVWSPFADGKTTLRGGAGLYFDWFDAQTYEQTLRVDGQRQQDQIIRNPGYPDAMLGGQIDVLPASRYIRDPALQIPMSARASFGVDRQLTQALRLMVTYAQTRGWRQLRGLNLNAPVPGQGRPDPRFGNITRVESSARAQSRSLSFNLNYMLPARRTFLAANYTLGRSWNEADGPFSLPADNLDPRADWGPSPSDSRHRYAGFFSTTLWKELRVSLNLYGTSATPYTVTTGFDNNGDTALNDRPAGVGRNSARGAGPFDMTCRVGWTFGFGTRKVASGGEPMRVIIRVGGDNMGGFMGGADDKRYRIEVYLASQNILNHTTPMGFSGVQTSPFFGRATAAMPARRLELGARFGF